MSQPSYHHQVNQPISRFMFALMYAAGTLVYFALPVWGGVFAEEYGFNAAQIGWLLSADMTSNAVANVTARYWIHRWQWQKTLVVLIVIFALANGLCFGQSDFMVLMLLRYIAGFAGGAMVSLAVAGIATTKSPDRDFGFALSLQVFLGGLLILSSASLVSSLGADAMYMVISIPALLCLLLLKHLPSYSNMSAQHSAGSSKVVQSSNPLLLTAAFAGVFIFFMGMNSLWSFAELIGEELGVSENLIAISLSLSLLISVVGSLLAAWMGGKANRFSAISLGTGITILSVLVLLYVPGGWMFFIAINIFNFGYNFIIPFQSGWVSKLDLSGKNIVLLPAIQGFGISLGPIAAGAVAEASNMLGIIYLSAGLLLLSMVAFGLLKLIEKNKTRVEPVKSSSAVIE